MTIIKSEAPQVAAEVIRQAIALRFPAFAELGANVYGARNPHVTVPAYHLGLDKLRRSLPLSSAEHTGWRFAMDAGSDFLLVKVGNTSDDSDVPPFQGIARGVIAGRLLSAVSVAELAFGYGVSKALYELRLLDVPGLLFVALWLKGTQNHFIPLMGGWEEKILTVGSEKQLFDHLRGAAAQKYDAQLPHRTRQGPTN